MFPIFVDPAWSSRFPGARMGLLEARNLEPLTTHPRLEKARLALEEELRLRWGNMARKQLREIPVLKVFESHYRPFGKTYHVLQQLESVASKGRSIPARLCAVTALFMAELKHGLVAAGHDLSCLEPPLRLAPSKGGERYDNLGQVAVSLPEGDMTLSHARGLLSSVLFGPAMETPIGPETRNALFTIYAPGAIPPGVLEAQLEDLASYLECFAPGVEIERAIAPAG
jgi:DNA/RNA-binding domain of Phe-tRNA-synthetase-like protein